MDRIVIGKETGYLLFILALWPRRLPAHTRTVVHRFTNNLYILNCLQFQSALLDVPTKADAFLLIPITSIICKKKSHGVEHGLVSKTFPILYTHLVTFKDLVCCTHLVSVRSDVCTISNQITFYDLFGLSRIATSNLEPRTPKLNTRTSDLEPLGSYLFRSSSVSPSIIELYRFLSQLIRMNRTVPNGLFLVQPGSGLICFHGALGEARTPDLIGKRITTTLTLWRSAKHAWLRSITVPGYESETHMPRGD